MSEQPTPETDSAQCEGLLKTNPIPIKTRSLISCVLKVLALPKVLEHRIDQSLRV